jgi:hypothetical protein
MKHRTLILLVVVGALLAGGLVGGVVEASASAPSTTYYACLAKGKLTMVGTSLPTCKPTATHISWNSQGPAGSTGSTGPPGAAGANGNTILHGTGAPTDATGSTGDFYVDTAGEALYGPKVPCHLFVLGGCVSPPSLWGSGTALVPGHVIDLHHVVIPAGDQSTMTVGSTSLGLVIDCGAVGPTGTGLTLSDQAAAGSSAHLSSSYQTSASSLLNVGSSALPGGTNEVFLFPSNGSSYGQWTYDDGTNLVALNLEFSSGLASCDVGGTALISSATSDPWTNSTT